MLNKRLEAVASFIDDNSSCLDVGCDHGLLDIYLAKNRKNIKLVASDINEKPLKNAKENFKKYKVDNIETRLGNGLDVIDREIDTVIISGMGGLTICDILKKDKLSNVKKIVLSPNKDFYEVRKKLNSLYFHIESEKIIKDKNKFYLVLSCNKGKEKYCKKNLKYGTKKMEKDDSFYDYLKYLLNKYNKQLKSIPSKYFLKKLKIKKEIIRIKSFL